MKLRVISLFFLLSVLLVIGSISAQPAKQSAKFSPLKLRMMTYNILNGGEPSNMSHIPLAKNVSTTDRHAMLVDIIKQVNPDVLFLQECNGWHLEDSKILKQMAQELGMQGVVAPNHSAYKLALLSKYAILSSSWLPDENPYSHNLLTVDLKLPGKKKLTFVSNHFGWWGIPGWQEMNDEQKVASYQVQSKILLDFLEEKKNSPFIIAGDFNHKPQESFYKQPALYHRIMETGYLDGYRQMHASYDNITTCGDGVIDYIFLSPAVKGTVKKAVVVDTPASRLASDHLPVWVDLELP